MKKEEKEPEEVAKARAEYIRMADALCYRNCPINAEARDKALEHLKKMEAEYKR